MTAKVAKLSSSGQWMWAEALRGNGDYDGTLVTSIDCSRYIDNY